jgi:hypothetical protein
MWGRTNAQVYHTVQDEDGRRVGETQNTRNRRTHRRPEIWSAWAIDSTSARREPGNVTA